MFTILFYSRINLVSLLYKKSWSHIFFAIFLLIFFSYIDFLFRNFTYFLYYQFSFVIICLPIEKLGNQGFFFSKKGGTIHGKKSSRSHLYPVGHKGGIKDKYLLLDSNTSNHNYKIDTQPNTEIIGVFVPGVFEELKICAINSSTTFFYRVLLTPEEFINIPLIEPSTKSKSIVPGYKSFYFITKSFFNSYYNRFLYIKFYELTGSNEYKSIKPMCTVILEHIQAPLQFIDTTDYSVFKSKIVRDISGNLYYKMEPITLNKFQKFKVNIENSIKKKWLKKHAAIWHISFFVIVFLSLSCLICLGFMNFFIDWLL